jgi:predicted ATPase
MLACGMDQYLREVSLDRTLFPDGGTGNATALSRYPFSLKAVRALVETGSLRFHPNVTFLVGENGSGKSTLLEALAVASGFNAEGGTRNFNFATEETHSILHQHLKLIRGVKAPRDGFFLRAESFYNLATTIDEMDRTTPLLPPLIHAYGGVSLHRQSHGESFMSLLLHRFGGKGLYLLDEPEAALSPMRQMSLISRMHELVEQDSQFIIATHSPILMAYPHASILSLDDQLQEVPYQQTEHYRITKAFLGNPDRMLRILMSSDSAETGTRE